MTWRRRDRRARACKGTRPPRVPRPPCDKDSDTGEREEGKTTWHRVVSFNPRVVNFAKHLDKGEKVAIEGAMDNRSFEKDGQTHYISEVVANTLASLSVKK